MTAPAPTKQSRRTRRRPQPSGELPAIVCTRCGGPVVRGQHVAPLFAAKLVHWDAHPVLSKPVTIRGVIACDGSGARTDLSIGEQLRQRAAMGGERERAELAAFEKLLAKTIAAALMADLEKEAAANGVDVRTWVARLAGAAKP